MPASAGPRLNIVPTDWTDAIKQLERQLNYLIKDIYGLFDYVKGIEGNVFSPDSVLWEHNHTAAEEGGDYAFGDIVAADVTYLQALEALIPVYSNIPSIVAAAGITGVWIFNQGSLTIKDTGGDHEMAINCGTDLSADRILTITPGDAARTITLSGNPTLADWFDQSVKQAASPTFAGATVNGYPVIPIPVGGVYLSTTGVDPSTELGYGTWSKVAQGQVLLGEV